MSSSDEMDLDESIGETQQLPNISENLDPHTTQFVLELPKEERDELYRIRSIILEKLIYNYEELSQDPKVNQQGAMDQLIYNVISNLIDSLAPPSLTDTGLGSSRPVVSRDMAKMREIIEYLTHSAYMAQTTTIEQRTGRAAVLLALVNLADHYDDTSDDTSNPSFHPIDVAVAEQQMIDNMMTTPRRGVKRSKSAPTIPTDADISDLTDGSAVPAKRRAKEKRDATRSQSTQPFLGGKSTRKRKLKRKRTKRKTRRRVKRRRSRRR